MQPCTAGWERCVERWLAYGDGPRALDRRRARAVVQLFLFQNFSPDNAIALVHCVKILMRECSYLLLSNFFYNISDYVDLKDTRIYINTNVIASSIAQYYKCFNFVTIIFRELL